MQKSLLIVMALIAFTQNSFADKIVRAYVTYEKFNLQTVPEYDKKRVEGENEKLDAKALAEVQEKLACQNPDIVNWDEQSSNQPYAEKISVQVRVIGICPEGVGVAF